MIGTCVEGDVCLYVLLVDRGYEQRPQTNVNIKKSTEVPPPPPRSFAGARAAPSRDEALSRQHVVRHRKSSGERGQRTRASIAPSAQAVSTVRTRRRRDCATRFSSPTCSRTTPLSRSGTPSVAGGTLDRTPPFRKASPFTPRPPTFTNVARRRHQQGPSKQRPRRCCRRQRRNGHDPFRCSHRQPRESAQRLSTLGNR